MRVFFAVVGARVSQSLVVFFQSGDAVFMISDAISLFFAQDGDLIEDRLLKRDFAEATGFDKVLSLVDTSRAVP